MADGWAKFDCMGIKKTKWCLFKSAENLLKLHNNLKINQKLILQKTSQKWFKRECRMREQVSKQFVHKLA